MNYGLPYMGSKSGIAEWIVSLLPAGETLVDLFAGGCAVTHCAMLHGRWRKFIANDISGSVQLFVDAVNGKYSNEKRWISYEDFFALKDTDAYVRYCWSFGNIGRTYLYSRTIEPYKKAAHYAILFDDWKDFESLCPEVCADTRTALEGLESPIQRRLEFQRQMYKSLVKLTGDSYDKLPDNPLYKSVHRKPRKTGDKMADMGSLESLQSLERLERLQSLESLSINANSSMSHRFSTFKLSYDEVPIPDGSTVYCDIPYKGTGGYGVEFDHNAFYDWALSREFPVFVSEYSMPDDFTCIAEIPKLSNLNPEKSFTVMEKMFVQNRYADKFNRPKQASLF